MKFFQIFSLTPIIFILFLSCEKKPSSISKDLSPLSKLDEISSGTLTKDEKVRKIQEIFKEIPRVEEDSLKKEILLKISYEYLRAEDSSNFRKTNKEALELSLKLNDSASIAAAFWDLGEFYARYNQLDSSYYFYSRSQELYEEVGKTFNSGRLLLNMAIVQKNIRDFTSSEITTVKSIRVLKPLKKYKQLYSAYNNLGIIFKEIGNYDKSLAYYEEAFSYLSKANRKDLYPSLWNNFGVVYENKGDYGKAIEYFDKALNFNEDILKKNKSLYAKLLDNRAYARLKSGDTTGVLRNLEQALNIRRELDLPSDITVNLQHLAEFYLSARKDTVSAIQFASQARALSLKTQNTRDLLSSLLMLSEIEKDSALRFSKEYIAISDSLQMEERAIRNKLARIRFETDEYISQTERLSERILRISVTALGIIIILILLYLFNNQRSRNRLMKQKEIANQEIYNLILAQQKKFEEGREKEKQHISRELHDGILGKLFGVRISLDSLNEEDDPDSKNKRSDYIKEIKIIAEEIRLVSHKLSKTTLVEVDFKTVLKELIQKQNFGKVDFQLEISSSIDWELIENDIKMNVYRIVQEAINNIHKHSKATKAEIKFDIVKNEIVLQIKDNGIGFEKNKLRKGIGFKNILARSRTIKGKLSFKSDTNGTAIDIHIPI